MIAGRFEQVRIRLAKFTIQAGLAVSELIYPFDKLDLQAVRVGLSIRESTRFELGASWFHRCRGSVFGWRILSSHLSRCEDCGEISPRRQREIDAECARLLRGDRP